MKATFRSIEGTYDILPTSRRAVRRSEAWQHVEGVIRDMMQRFAFQEIRTPVLEPLSLIARGVGEASDIVTKEMFAFIRGRTHYVLRPEMTAPVMRAYLQHHLEQHPGEQRLFYMGPCFRAERPQKGRYRQFHQFGVEILGAIDPRADAEVISCALEIYGALGLTGTTLRINTLGDANSRVRYIEALCAYFAPYEAQLTSASQQRLQKNPLRILDTKVKAERALVREAPRLIDYVDSESRAHYEAVKALLDEVNISYTEDPHLVRGLDYYTRTAFEIEGAGLGAQNALAGGGRYDLLSQSIGSSRSVPAVGFAAGMERLLLALEAGGQPWPAAGVVDTYLLGLGEAAAPVLFVLAHQLRRKGLSVIQGPRWRSMKAQLRTAHRLKARCCVIVGDNEVATGQATAKDMAQGTQQLVSFDALPDYLLSYLR